MKKVLRRYKKYVSLRSPNKGTTGCSVARSSRLVWDEEVAGSNPATPTKEMLASPLSVEVTTASLNKGKCGARSSAG